MEYIKYSLSALQTCVDPHKEDENVSSLKKAYKDFVSRVFGQGDHSDVHACMSAWQKTEKVKVKRILNVYKCQNVEACNPFKG